jgi:hypothetical protein
MKNLEEEIDSTCWLCKQHEQTTDHRIPGRPILAKNEYLMRRDKFDARLHYSIRKAHTHTHTHTHTVYEHEDVTVLWSTGVHTDIEVTANGPDIILKTRKRKHAY